MYIDYFKLNERPFSIAPDPRYLYMSTRHQEALAHLLYGVRNGGGFVALTGEVGTGKTTLCYSLLEQLPDDVDIALLLNPRLNSVELLANLCDELSITYPEDSQSLKVLTNALNGHLLTTHARGYRTVVMIDEAQNLSFEVLEQLRLLTNLETTQSKLLQIILVGQPELNQLLARNELRQLTQRITARYHLQPLSANETSDYIRHRLTLSGGNEHIFSRAAIHTIHRASKGIPRLINIISDRALLGAFTQNQPKISRSIAKHAAKEVLYVQAGKPLLAILGLSAATLGVIGIGSMAYFSKQRISMAPPLSAKMPVKNNATIAEPVVSKPVTLPVSKLAIETAEQTTEKPIFQNLIQSPQWTLDTALNQLYSFWLNHGSHQRSTLQRLARRSHWNQMLAYNRPVVLELELKNRDKRYLILVRIEQNRPVVQLGNNRYTLNLEKLLPYWQGYYALLWKPPAPGVTLLKTGDHNPSVLWLRDRLNSAGYPVKPTGKVDFFDFQLKLGIIQYQLDHHLNDDGLVGARTMIELNSNAHAVNIPKLIEDKD